MAHPTSTTGAGPRWRPNGESLTWLATAALAAGASLWPHPNAALLAAVGWGLFELAPVVAIAAILAGALALSDVADRITC